MAEEAKKPEEAKAEEKPAETAEKSEEDKEKEKKEKKKKERQGKKPHKNKKPSQRWKKYKIEGDNITKEKTCPRCGPGIFLMKAKNRLYCGKCHYTDFISSEKKPEETEKEETDSNEK
tara:strand:+ start:721 stop:1074 length:354 start_codon:yes stop_codon:yes gene_type:complete